MTAVFIMLDVAFHAGRSGVVSGTDIAERGDMLRRGIEPVLQALSRAGLLSSVRGPKGGYRLGRPARTITLNEIVETVTEDRASVAEDGNLLRTKVLEPFWSAMDTDIAEKMRAVTLERLLQDAEAAGMQRPSRAPIYFSI